jgi:glycosyltransferase involved in cell wall biosynthesis
MRPLRIVQFNNLGFEAGGAEKSVRLLTQGLRGRGHEVTVVATDHQAAGREPFADVVLPTASGGPAARLLGHFWNRHTYRSVSALMRELDPDCVHLHTIGGFSPSLLAATRAYPRVLSARGPEEWTLDLLRWNLPSATRPEGLTAADRLRYAHLRFLQRPAYRLWLRGIDAVVPISAYMAGCVRADVPRVPMRVIPNNREDGYEPMPVRDPYSLLFFGRLAAVKGVAVLLDAFRQVLAEHPRARLTVVGDGPDRAQLETSAMDLVAADRLAFTGWLGRDDIRELLRACGLVVVPSIWPEVFGRVALDAQACGRGVVASRVGGLPELVVPGTGALTTPGDAGDLARTLSGLVGDLETLTRLGAAAAEHARAYSLENTVDLHEQLYSEVAKVPRG